ncbi:MAG: DUF2851 family protein [Bacteroidetes bacterium]|nr:DUF2851 family protein [Bacteroidota bacterium]
MTEEFLHYVWQFRLYKANLSLVSGEPLEILHPGVHNLDSGPDFFNARIRIDETTWAGNIEIHINSSDWFRHHHHLDKAYGNVILHVVYHSDRQIALKDGNYLPELELKSLIDQHAWQRYLLFMGSKNWIPCENLITGADPVVFVSWLDALLVNRIERKAKRVGDALIQSGNDWNAAFFRLLARNMGFKLNNDAFEQLALILSYKQLARHSDKLFQLEALIFGQAGLLQGNFKDSYPLALRKEFKFLSKKYSLQTMDEHQWRFMRLHPGNFPTFRLSQFAQIIHRSNGFMMKFIDSTDVSSLHELLSCEASEYWKTHYRFDSITAPSLRKLGIMSVNLLLINLVTPFMFVYGKTKNKPELVERSVQLLEITKGENNSITRSWAKHGIDVSRASQTQALLELKSNYCDQKKCLTCRIGLSLLK